MVEAWRLRSRGMSQNRIARELGLSQGTVSRLLAAIERRMLREFAGEWERLKVTQNAQLEHIVEEAIEAWHRSKTPRKRAASKTAVGDGDGQGDEVRTTEVIERDGDTGYLYAAMQGLAHIRGLWGLDVAPAMQDATSTVAEVTRSLFRRVEDHERREAEEAAAENGATPPGPEPGGVES